MSNRNGIDARRDELRCTATSKRTGERCGAYRVAIIGATKCFHHHGNWKQVREERDIVALARQCDALLGTDMADDVAVSLKARRPQRPSYGKDPVPREQPKIQYSDVEPPRKTPAYPRLPKGFLGDAPFLT